MRQIIVICHIVLAVAYLYDGQSHRSCLVKRTSYVCGALWVVIAVYKYINMTKILKKIQNFVYTVSRVDRLMDFFIEEFQALDPFYKVPLVMFMIFSLTVFLLEWYAWNHPADYITKEDDSQFGEKLFILMTPLLLLFLAVVMWVEDNYAISAVLIFITIITTVAVYRFFRQISIIYDEENLI